MNSLTALQKLSPKTAWGPISRKSKLRGRCSKKSTFFKNSHRGNGPMSFAAKEKKKKKASLESKEK